METTTTTPTPVTETNESVSVQTPVPTNKKAIYIASVFFAIAIIASSVFVYYKKQNVASAPTNTTKEEVKLNYVKTEFKDAPPTDFLKEIPLPANVSFEQSYGLQYATGKQLTVVFPSPKTRKENFTLYKDFLTKDKWQVKNSTEGKSVSSLYATKEKNDLNITISENTTDKGMKSQVSVSVLKR